MFPFDTQKCKVVMGSASNSIENLIFDSVVEYDRAQQHLMVLNNISLTSIITHITTLHNHITSRNLI
jgi:hypothetical protein